MRRFFCIIILTGFFYSCSDETPVSNEKPGDTDFTGTNFFIGDSHVQGWDVKGYFPGRRTENLGVSGEKIWQINSRLEKIAPDSASNCFVIAGTNDFISLSRDSKLSVPAIRSEILGHYSYLLQTASSRFKNVYMISIFPVGSAIDCIECRTRHTAVPLINDSLQHKCADIKNVTFINVEQHLMGSDSLLKSMYSFDGIHLEKNGYDVLSALVLPYVR